jgi:prepilin-type processing-associated H-X9-DG protein
MYFLRHNIVITDSNTFFTSLQPSYEGPGNVVFCDGSDDPFPHGFKLHEGQGQA